MNVNSLHTLVTGAIWRAEQLEDQGTSSAPLAWAEVSSREEELANALPVSQPEGRIARRGAVLAALKARDHARAHALAERYLAEKGTPKSLRAALQEMLERDASSLAARFPHAPKHHGVHEARDLARWLQQGGPFGLADLAAA